MHPEQTMRIEPVYQIFLTLSLKLTNHLGPPCGVGPRVAACVV